VTALLKQRLIGAIVLISLGIIFIPMLLTGKGDLTTGELATNIPPKPLYEIQAPAVLPLEDNASTDKAAEPVSNASVAKAIDDNPQQPLEKPKAESEQAKSAESESDQTVAQASSSKTDQDQKAVDPEKPESVDTESAKSVPPVDADTKQIASKSSESAPSEKTQQSQVTQVQKIAQAPQKTQAPQVTQEQEKVATTPKKPPIVSGWIVQLGSFSKEKNAIKLRDSLRKNGHASFVEAYERSGKTSYRVRVGPELTRELAEELKKQLKKETKLDGLVMSFPG
jgi:DedD protein